MATCNGILIKYFPIPAKNAKIFLYTLRNLGKKGGKKMHLWPKLGNRYTARHGRAVKNTKIIWFISRLHLREVTALLWAFVWLITFFKIYRHSFAFISFRLILTSGLVVWERIGLLLGAKHLRKLENLFQKKIHLMKRNDRAIIIKSIPIIYFHFGPIFAEFKSS